jgi:hypothetical protein
MAICQETFSTSSPAFSSISEVTSVAELGDDTRFEEVRGPRPEPYREPAPPVPPVEVAYPPVAIDEPISRPTAIEEATVDIESDGWGVAPQLVSTQKKKKPKKPKRVEEDYFVSESPPCPEPIPIEVLY